MEERKLNFSAPLLSVRRFATTSVSMDGENAAKIIESLPPNTRKALPSHEPYFNLDQVTEPAAIIPFHWEQTAGTPKLGNEPESQSPEKEASVTPRLPPGKAFDVMKQSLRMDYSYQNGSWPQIKAYSFNDKVMESKCSKERLNQRGDLELEDDDDNYSDALDTLSSIESVSLNCSASGLSGHDGADVKPSGTFSADIQTRDFMMKRFLPAAKAMVLESPHYATRRQPMALEKPREFKKMISEDKTTLHSEKGSDLVPQYGQYQEEEESEGEADEYDASPNISAKGCGLFPRLNFKNSLCLLNPLPGMKVRTQARISSTPKLAKIGKMSNNQSQSKSANKVVKSKWGGDSSRFTYSGDLQKGKSSPFRQPQSGGVSPCRNEACHSPFPKASNCGRSAELQVVKSKLAGESSRFSFSGELPKGRSSSRHPWSGGISPYQNEVRRSPFPGESDCQVLSAEQVVKGKLAGESSRFTYSGELQRGRSSPFRQPRSGGISPYRNEARQFPFPGESDRGVLSAELQAVKSKLAGESSRFAYSGELPKVRPSPFQQPRSGGISPYRNEARRSPFRGGGLLGIPKEENIKANNRTNLYSKSNNKFQEVLSHQRNKQGSFSRSPTIEKTVYVDTVNVAEVSCPNSGSIGTKGQLNSAGDEFENFHEQMEKEETTTAESLFQDVKCLSIVEGPEVIESFDDKQSSLSEISHLNDQAVTMEGFRFVFGQETKSMDSRRSTANENPDMDIDQVLKADEMNVNASSVMSPLPPPLPKSPSESWLWRTIPSVSMKNPISHMNLGFLSKKLESKKSSNNTKWETIVKTSNLHHDHVRYSEELISHVSQQSKT
ncbi:hypothetical protein FNV43_RR08226 [Rhamnella rubrinervis]|uniref:Uncharacterized protein n=1 Tax=Rhamnella rubrinervis TaxID=2594499 RepID=A0A8K0HI31_9ROSA|nr:hypothetical protein FNV43_RR08226 [Rhamnella rubrinervis]